MTERIERALVLLAYFIEQGGDKYLPYYEKLERDLEEHKAKEDIKARAKRRLMAYSDGGALKAIR